MKKLWILLAGLAALLLIGFAGTKVAKADHTHCICGAPGGKCVSTATTYGHEGDSTRTAAEPVTWTRVTSETEFLAAAQASSASSLYVYFDADDKTQPISIETNINSSTSYFTNKRVYICLNGCTIQSKGTGRLFQSTASAEKTLEVSICDCSETANSHGVIKAPEGTAGISAQGGIACITYGAFYLYGGEITGGVAKTYGGNCVFSGTSKSYIYNGIISNGESGRDNESGNRYGGNIALLSTSTFKMYGGTIKNGNAKIEGGNAYFGTSTPVEILGGSFEGGEGNSAGNIRIAAAASVTIKNGAKIIGGINRSNNNGNTASVSGKLVIDNAFIDFRQTNNVALITSSGGKIEINNGVFGRTDGYTGNIRFLQAVGGGKVIINGGVFDCQIEGYNSNMIITGGTFLHSVYHSGTDAGTENEKTGSIQVTGGLFLSAPTKGSSWTGKKQVVYGNFVETADASPVTGKKYYIRKVGGSTPETWYLYSEAATDLSEFEAGTVYCELDESAKIVSYKYSTNYRDANNTATSCETSYAVIPSTAPIGMRLALGENLSVRFETEGAALDTTKPYFATTRMSFEIGGVAKDPASPVTTDVTRYTFAGITPELLGDTITAVFEAQGSDSNWYPLYTGTAFTLADYLDELPTTAEYAAYSSEKKAALDTLIDDLLVYAREAQTKFNHTANPVGQGITGSGRTSTANDYAQTPTLTNATEAAAAPGYFKSATVIHENQNWIRVLFQNNGGDPTFTYQIEGGTPVAVTLNQGYLCTGGLKPADYGKVITFTATYPSETVTMTYSVNTYCARLSGDDFVDALYNYGVSAAAFAATN